MRLCFNVDLPERDLRVGEADMSTRSAVGAEGREYKRFFPLILCLESLCKVNEWQLTRFREQGLSVAPLYQSGVYYKAEPPGEEEWLDIPTLYKQGFGDCEDLACARVAELRDVGIAATPAIRHKLVQTKRGPVTLVHVLCLWPDGQVEDPSKILGMKGDYQ